MKKTIEELFRDAREAIKNGVNYTSWLANKVNESNNNETVCDYAQKLTVIFACANESVRLENAN